MFDDVVRVVWFHIQVHWFVVFFSERLVDMFQQIEFNVQVVCHLGNWLNFDLQILTAKNFVKNNNISFKTGNFYAKIDLILYPKYWSSTTKVMPTWITVLCASMVSFILIFEWK